MAFQGRTLTPVSRSCCLSLRLPLPVPQLQFRRLYWQHDAEKGEVARVHKTPGAALSVPTASPHLPIPFKSIGPQKSYCGPVR